MENFPETVEEFLDGQILLIDKPLGWTSFDVVKKIKNLIRKKYNLKKIKVGHAGTLDPPICSERVGGGRGARAGLVSNSVHGRTWMAGVRTQF